MDQGMPAILDCFITCPFLSLVQFTTCYLSQYQKSSDKECLSFELKADCEFTAIQLVLLCQYLLRLGCDIDPCPIVLRKHHPGFMLSITQS